MDISSSDGISPRNKRHPRAHRGADSGDHASKEANRGPLYMFPRLGQRLRLAPTRRALLILRVAASSGRPEADLQRHLPGKPGGIGGHATHHRSDAIPFDNVQKFEAAYGESGLPIHRGVDRILDASKWQDQARLQHQYAGVELLSVALPTTSYPGVHQRRQRHSRQQPPVPRHCGRRQLRISPTHITATHSFSRSLITQSS